MTRIWAAAASGLAVVLILAGLVVFALAGSVHDHWMTGGSDRDPGASDGGPARSAPEHMGEVQGSEYEYLQHMIGHHQEAIDAAQQLSRSERQDMREFGAAIVASQSAQVAQMRGWLDAWYGNVPPSNSSYVPEMRDLTGLSGAELDRAFLTDMVGHHMVAVMASQRLLAKGRVEHDEVAMLARRIRDEQYAEIAQMRSWLRDWFQAP